MWEVAAILAAGCVALLYGRAWRQRRAMRELAEAMENRRLYIADKGGLFGCGPELDRLARAGNQLVAATADASREQNDFLLQIEATLGALREGVIIFDPGNVVVMANDVVRQFVGHEQPLLGQRLERLLPSAGFLDYVNALQRGEHRLHEEVEIRRGRTVSWFEVVGARLPQQASSEAYTLVVLHDITERKRLETIRTEFVANVSHELRTPITVIKGFCDTLLDDHHVLDAEERGRFLQKIHRNAERLDTLLVDLLALARIESSREPPTRERVALADLVAETCEHFRDRLEPGQELVVERAPGEIPVKVDPVGMAQALENLLENARRHARGMRRLRVILDGDGRSATCTVADDGCGIPEADLPRIFERFYRVDKGRSRERGGTGLGLAIVKHIVQQHGGSVRVESETGRGSRFRIVLPAEQPAGAAR